MSVTSVTIKITGDTALLMHADTLADPLSEVTKAFKRVSGKRAKTDEDHEAMAAMEYRAGLYVEGGAIVIPGRNIVKALIEGGRITKSGAKIERGFGVLGTAFPLDHDGPADLDALYRDKNFVSRMTVKVGTSKTIRCRPLFRRWGLDVAAYFDPAVLSLDELQDIAADAGQMIGLGDYRKGGGFGRFSAVVGAA